MKPRLGGGWPVNPRSAPPALFWVARAPTVGLALIKRALDAAETNDLSAQLDLERELQREASQTPDFAEGVGAFLEKRQANFTGRRSR